MIQHDPPASLRPGHKYRVLHRTVFHYLSPVTDSVNTLHLEPRTFPFQKTLAAFVKVLPAVRVRRFQDLFDNVTHHFEVGVPHGRLEVESRIRIQNLPLEVPEGARQAVLGDYHAIETREVTWAYLQECRYVSRHPEIWRQALDLTRDTESVYEQALAIMSWVHREFRYEA